MTDYLQRVNEDDELIVIDTVRQEIRDGYCYYGGHLFLAVANDASANAYLKTGSEYIKYKFFVDSTQTIDIYFYEGAVIDTSGNSIPLLNFNRNISSSFGATAYHTPVIDTSGNVIGFRRVFATTTILAKGGSTAAEGEFGRILKPNTNYLMQIYNRSGSATADIQLNIRICNLAGYVT